MVKVFNEKAWDSWDAIYFYLSPTKFAWQESLDIISKMRKEIGSTSESLKQWVNDDFERISFCIEGQKLYTP